MEIVLWSWQLLACNDSDRPLPSVPEGLPSEVGEMLEKLVASVGE